MEEAARANRVVVISDGCVRLDGTPKEVFSQVELLKSMGLEVPQPTYLLHRLRKEGYDLPEGCLTVEEATEALLMLYQKRKKTAD
jgi:energy-coupling factor transport system ATP-binding protein